MGPKQRYRFCRWTGHSRRSRSTSSSSRSCSRTSPRRWQPASTPASSGWPSACQCLSDYLLHLLKKDPGMKLYRNIKESITPKKKKKKKKKKKNPQKKKKKKKKKK